MSYITTVSGKHFDPVHPQEELIEAYDIAHSLSLVCRGNGHCRFFYSVAQHCLACAKEAEARGETDRVILGCLLHDASEAYLSDVTRPIKQELKEYLRVEDVLQDLIWAHFLGTAPTAKEREKIFAIDDLMLSLEFHQIMFEDVNEDYKNLTRPHECAQRDWVEVQQEFLEMLRQYVPKGGRA